MSAAPHALPWEDCTSLGRRLMKPDGPIIVGGGIKALLCEADGDAPTAEPVRAILFNGPLSYLDVGLIRHEDRGTGRPLEVYLFDRQLKGRPAGRWFRRDLVRAPSMIATRDHEGRIVLTILDDQRRIAMTIEGPQP